MFDNFNWINEGEIKIEENKVVIKAPALTDFFCGGNVDGPNLIRMVDFKPFQQVRINFIGRLRLACILPWIYSLYTHFLHMPKDCFVINQIMLFFVKIPANATVSIHRVSGIDFVNHLLYVQILCGMWSRLIIEPASIKFQKAGLYRNGKR